MDVLTQLLSPYISAEAIGAFVILIGIIRGACATASEAIPDRFLGPLAPIVNLLGGNNLNAKGSE